MTNSKHKQANILILMVDQLSGEFFPDGPADLLHAPNLKKLAQSSVKFNNTYCASPLCSPARASFMTGNLRSLTQVYDGLTKGKFTAWDFPPVQNATDRYMRNHLDLNEVEAGARFPNPKR